MKAATSGPEIYARNRKLILLGLLCITLIVAMRPLLGQADTAGTDARVAFGPGSPQWLRAVGRLTVPSSRYADGRTTHHLEDCSATLVASASSSKADIVITAWHCLENYRDLSRTISFSAHDNAGRLLSREAYRLADGGGMHRDWALLRLFRPIRRDELTALSIHPQQADPAMPITMAGYSRDSGLGEGGERLTYDANCRITARAGEGDNSDCLAYKGASGGAVIQISTSGQPLYAGVISRGDSTGISVFVPVTSFRTALRQHLD